MSWPVIAPFVGIGVGIGVGLGMGVEVDVGLGIGVGLGRGGVVISAGVPGGLEGVVENDGMSFGPDCIPHPAAIRMNRPTTHSFFTDNSPARQ